MPDDRPDLAREGQLCECGRDSIFAGGWCGNPGCSDPDLDLFETRGVLQGRLFRASVDDPTDLWWLLLDCGCTLSCAYKWGAPVWRRMHCPEHPLDG